MPEFDFNNFFHRLVLSGVFFCLLILINTIIYFVFFKEKNSVFKCHKFDLNILQRMKMKHVIAVFDLLLFFGALVLFVSAFFIRPFAVIAGVEPGTYLRTAAPVIELNFNAPVKKQDIKIHISQEVDGTWQYVEYFSPLMTGYIKKAIFRPKRSFYPESKIVVYAVGLKRLFPGGAKHEQAITFYGPKVPNLIKSVPADGQEGVSVNDPIELNFDIPGGPFVSWRYELMPPVPFLLEQINDTKVRIKPENPLFADSSYVLNVYRSPRSFDVNTDQVVERVNYRLVSAVSFKTATPPSIVFFEPQGYEVRANNVIKIEFSQEMNQQMFDKSFSIEPKTEGEIIWSDPQTMVFKPKSGLKKDTQYRIILAAGLVDAEGGITFKDTELRFKTLGNVYVAGTYPRDGSSGLPVDLNAVSVTFDQPVDRQSAENSFSISPFVPGRFFWKGNKMTYTFNSGLSYSTDYSVKIGAGVKSIYGLDMNNAYGFSFHTQDKRFSLDVPLYQQQEIFTCNIAAARMVLAYRGVNLSEADIIGGVGKGDDPDLDWVDGYGVHWAPIANFIGRFTNVEIKRNWNLSSLINQVRAGNPVIVWWYNNYSQAGSFELDSNATGYHGMHSEVVIGYVGEPDNPRYILTNDPWRGLRRYTPEFFNSIWSYLGNTAVVIH